MKHRPAAARRLPPATLPVPGVTRGSLAVGLLVLAGGALLGGCATAPEPAPTAETTKYTLENTDRFVVLDRVGGAVVTCTGLTDHALADGRLEVVANLKNRETHPVTIQTNCVFKDEAGSSLVEETAWQSVTVPAGATEAVRFTASNPGAHSYTVQLRHGR